MWHINTFRTLAGVLASIFITFLAIMSAMLRLGVSDIAAWELAVSIAVLVLSIIGVMFLVIRAFRIYLLMYGKRPNWGEIIQNLRSG